MVSVGVNVAVTVDVPAFPKSNSEPDTEATDVVADTYDHEPAIELITVGAVIERFASPYVADTFDQLNNGVTCATVKVIATVPPDT